MKYTTYIFKLQILLGQLFITVLFLSLYLKAAKGDAKKFIYGY